MIVRISSKGKSFSGLAAYLTHDPKEKTAAERVAWTHTFNLAHDHVPSAVDEMLWTARNAELLKQEAGIRAGGRQTENTVKHLSLNWAPDETPTKEHMISTTEAFLEHMKWQDHQAVLVAHQDKTYSHVHVMLNTVNPENGLVLSDGFDQRRAQSWALNYELENERIYCEQRLADVNEREEAPTRPVWMAFQERQTEYQRDENNLTRDGDNSRKPKNVNAEDWKTLKEYQREERQDFFSEGKSAFSLLRRTIYSEVREEFRDRWADYYKAEKAGADDAVLSVTKSEILTDQNSILAERRDKACQDLRQTRDGQYRELLDDQREARLGLRWRQEAGLDDGAILQTAQDKVAGKHINERFTEAADEMTVMPKTGGLWKPTENGFTVRPHREDNGGMKSSTDIAANLSFGVGFGMLSIFDSLADGLIHSNPAPKPQQPEPDNSGPNPFVAAAEETRKRQQGEDRRAADDDEYYRKQRSAGD